MAPRRKSAAAAGAAEVPEAPPRSERRCDEHVQRTAEYLGTLGLHEVARSAPGGPLPSADQVEPADGGQEGPPAKRRRAGEGVTGQTDGAGGEPVEASRCWLRRSRAAIVAPGLGGSAPGSPGAWRAEAVRRWGEAVPAEGDIGDWEAYVRSRLPTPPPPSPQEMMQERYAYDPWRLLTVCVLMARISSERVKTETIAAFFARCASPSALLAAEADAAAKEELQRILKPLGLVDNRIRTLVELSRGFLHMPAFDCGHEKRVNKIWGCGAFAVDSYLIFCRGRCLAETADASCQAYLDWWRGQGPEVEPAPAEGSLREGAPQLPKPQPTPNIEEAAAGQPKGRPQGARQSNIEEGVAGQPEGRPQGARQSDLRRFFGA